MSKHNIQVGVLTLGMIATNCYFVFDADRIDENGKKHVVVFDPADAGKRIFEELSKNDLVVDLILLTHGHFDHIMGIPELKELTGAKVGCYEKETAICSDPHLNLSVSFGNNFGIKPDVTYKDGDIIKAAGLSFKLIATPGHTSGGCCYYIEDDNVLISGDTLFEESVGRSDFPTSSTSELVRSVREKLFVLPDETIVYPGHGDITTIGHEKEYNPYA